MKELSIEEKAKRYYEAIERAKDICNYPSFPVFIRADVVYPELKESEDEKIRKELTEFLKSASGGFLDTAIQCKTFGKWAAWLEKQGEQKHTAEEVLIKAGLKPYKDGDQWCVLLGDNIQEGICGFGNTIEDALYAFLKDLIASQGVQKPADKIESKFKIGDEIRTCNEESLTITKIDEKGYWSGDLFVCSFEDSAKWELVGKLVDNVEPKFHKGEWLCENEPNNYARFIQILEIVNVQGKDRDRISRNIHKDEDVVEFGFVEKYYHKFDIQDAKDGDVLCYKDEISLYKHDIKNCTKQETTFGGFVYHCCYDGKRFIMDSLYSLTEQDKMDIHPATKEQRDQLEKAMADAGYTFDFEKKELKKIEQKPTWSEEDEAVLDALIRCLEGEDIHVSVHLAVKCLKSLKNRVQPKQEWSEEDEVKINRIVACLENLNVATMTFF